MEQLNALGVEVRERTVMLDGKPRTIPHLYRVESGKQYYHPLNFAGPGEIIQFQVIRSVCNALKLDPASFGLHLDKSLEL